MSGASSYGNTERLLKYLDSNKPARAKPLPVYLVVRKMRVPAVTHAHFGIDGSHNNMYIVISIVERDVQVHAFATNRFWTVGTV